MGKQGKKPDAPQAAELTRTKQEWIERADLLAAERFEVAGALFELPADAQVGESAVKQKLITYKEGAKQ